MTYLLKVEDFANIEENKSSFVINDMVAICKRNNNPNRDYLFVNKYQAKHYPVKAHNTLQLFYELYQEIKRQIPSDKRILVVGFSETATGIAQAIMHMALENKDLKTVFYLQTTRESINTDIQNISFEEEHSHASTQKLYYRSDIPDYDTVLFIEDEITTGNTIVNFIEKFQKVKDGISFAAASILNWQNTKNRKIFQEKEIKRIYLVSGQMRDNTPLIELKETTLEKPRLTSDVHYHLSDNLNPRTGLTKEEFLVFQKTALNRLTSQVSRKSKEETIAVIGTEENMFVNFNNIHPDVAQIVVAVVIYSGKNRKQYFGQVKNAYVRLVDQAQRPEKEIARFNLSEDGGKATAVKFAELTRTVNGWTFKAVGEYLNASIQDIEKSYR